MILSTKLKVFVGLFLFPICSGFSQTWEIFDATGKIQSRAMYDRLEILGETVKIGKNSSGLFLLATDLKPMLILQGQEIYQYLAPWILVKDQNGIGAYHEYGQQVLPLSYDRIQTYTNLLLANKGNEFWLYQRGSGKTISLGKFDEAWFTNTGFIIAKIGNNYYLPLSKTPKKPFELLRDNEGSYILAKEESGFGLINREGDYVLRPVLNQLDHLSGNFYFGFDEEQYLLVEGDEVNANVRYNSFHRIALENGVLLEYIHGKLRRVMKEDGILLDAVGMEEVTLQEKNLYNVRFRDAKLGLLGENGWLVQPMSNVDQIKKGSERLYPAKSKGVYGFVNAGGNWVINPQFEEVGDFSENIASFRNSAQWGLVSSSGIQISDPQWDEIRPFTNGLALARAGNSFFLLNKEGKAIHSEAYEAVCRLEEGYFLVEKNGKRGLLNPEGIPLLELEYDSIHRERQDFILVGKEGKVGVVNESGSVIIPLAYQEILADLDNNQIMAKAMYEPVVVLPESTNKRKKGT
jgi:hypothetical protein